MILDKIDQLLNEVNNLSAQNAEEIEQLRLKYLSKKGEITALMADFRNVAADQKKADEEAYFLCYNGCATDSDGAHNHWLYGQETDNQRYFAH